MIKYIVTLCDTAYLDLSQDQYDNLNTIRLLEEGTNKVLGEAKEVILPRGMVLIVPLSEFNQMKSFKNATKPKLVEPKVARQ